MSEEKEEVKVKPYRPASLKRKSPYELPPVPIKQITKKKTKREQILDKPSEELNRINIGTLGTDVKSIAENADKLIEIL